MAAKSVTVAASAGDVLASLRAQAGQFNRRIDQTPLQNGTRIKLTSDTGAIGLNVYPSKSGGCKIVFDRPESTEADSIVELLSARPSQPAKTKSGAGALAPVLPAVSAWAGSDESGKGDYFGPLVVAAVATTSDNWRVLEALGVQDSKNITDARATALAAEIKPAFANEVVVIMPQRYNELWSKFGNLNRLLAWGHARAIENVLERAPDVTAAVADQFGDESLIRDALFRRGQEIRLVQMPRAERDPAVAAASILARAEFLRRLDQLGREAGVRLPKGASAAVDAVGRSLVAAHGAAVLSRVAKQHFKTTARILAGKAH